MERQDTEIREYLAANQYTYTRDALRQQLIERGYDPARVDAAVATIGWQREQGPMGEEGERRRRLLTGYVMALFLAVFLAFGFASTMGQPGYQVLLAFFGVQLLVGGLIALAIVRRRWVVEHVTTAVAVGLLVPFLIVVGISGACASITGVRFFPGPTPTFEVPEG